MWATHPGDRSKASEHEDVFRSDPAALLLFPVTPLVVSTQPRASGFPETDLPFTHSPTVVIVANGGGSSAVAVPVVQETIAKIVSTRLSAPCECDPPLRAGGMRLSISDCGLRLVALFKFTKAVALVAAGLGTLRLLDPDFAVRAESWSAALATGSGCRMLAHVLARVVGLPPGRLELLGIGALLSTQPCSLPKAPAYGSGGAGRST